MPEFETQSARLVPRAGRPNRYCPECNLLMGEGPDICLGELPGVSHACCGHGDLKRAYVVIGGDPDQSCLTIRNGVQFRGRAALEFFDLVRRGVRIVDGEPMLPDTESEKDKTHDPRRDAMALPKDERVYRSILKKTPRTAAQIAEKAGFESGRSISNELGILVGEGSVIRQGVHSGNTRPTYIKKTY